MLPKPDPPSMYSKQEKLRVPLKRVFGELNDERHKRNQRLVTLRKRRRQATLKTRRNEIVQQTYSPFVQSKIPLLHVLAHELEGADSDTVTTGLAKLRLLFTDEGPAPIDEVVKAGIVPRLVGLISRPRPPDCSEGEWAQFLTRVCWCLTNIAAGSENHADEIVRANAVPILVRFLGSRVPPALGMQAAWVMGHLVDDSPRLRDYVLKCHALPELMVFLGGKPPPDCVFRSLWAMSRICGGDPRPALSMVGIVVPMIVPFLALAADVEVDPTHQILVVACQTLREIGTGGHDRIQVLIEHEVVPPLIEILKSSNEPEVLLPAVELVECLADGTPEQREILFRNDVVIRLRLIIFQKSEGEVDLRCAVVRATTKLCIDATRPQVESLVRLNLFENIISMVYNRDPPFRLKLELVRMLREFFHVASPKNCQLVISCSCLGNLSKWLMFDDVEMCRRCLGAIREVLHKGESLREAVGINPWVLLFEFSDLLVHLERLVQNKNRNIAGAADQLIRNYFCAAPTTRGASELKSLARQLRHERGDVASGIDPDAPPLSGRRGGDEMDVGDSERDEGDEEMEGEGADEAMQVDGDATLTSVAPEWDFAHGDDSF